MSNLAIKAQATGNWSAAGTWAGGVIPGAGDTAYTNSYTVTIDQAVGGAHTTGVLATALVAGVRYKITTPGTTAWTSFGAANSFAGTVFLATGVGTGTGVATALTTITNIVGPSGFTSTAGGKFVCTTTRTITANILQGAAAFNCLDLTGNTVTATLVGDIYAGTVAAYHAVDTTGSVSLTLNITGNIINGTTNTGHALQINSSTAIVSVAGALVASNALGYCINIAAFSSFTATGMIRNTSSGFGIWVAAASGTVNFIGEVNGGGAAGGSGIRNASTASVVVTGDCYGGGNNNTYAIYNSSSGTVSVTGNVYAGGGSAAHGILSASGIMTVIGDIHASGYANGICVTSFALNILRGNAYDYPNGFCAINVLRYKLSSTPINCVRRCALDTPNFTVVAGDLVTGTSYVIRTAGDTDWTIVGAANNNVGTLFTATGLGSGTGVANLAASANYVNFYTADNMLTHAAAGDVKTGITYGTAGALTGTLDIPTAAQVAFGVPVGSTVGTAVLTVSTVRQAVAQSG